VGHPGLAAASNRPGGPAARAQQPEILNVARAVGRLRELSDTSESGRVNKGSGGCGARSGRVSRLLGTRTPSQLRRIMMHGDNDTLPPT
jgi:hypothetical protein